VMMFFAEPAEDGPSVTVPTVLAYIPIFAGVLLTAVLGVFPQWLIELTDNAAKLRG
jgi:NADH-quinone oxidoreductase subunit N